MMPDNFLCIPRLVNVDSWPAYMCLILAEGGKLRSRHPVSIRRTSDGDRANTTGIMFLTLLKKYSESYGEWISYGSRWHLIREDTHYRLSDPEERSYNRAFRLYKILYRDGRRSPLTFNQVW